MTTSASLQSPIDEENIKIEEVPSLSSNNVTANSSSSSVDTIDVKRGITRIRVKKEEEKVDDEDENHNDGIGTSARTSKSNQNYDLNRSVKKEEEVENNDNDDDDIKITCKEMGAQCDDDNDYSDWKAGDWCWVLPAGKNTQQLTSRSVKSDTSTSTAVISVNNTTTNDSSSSSIRSRTTRGTKTKRATRSIDDETAPAAEEASSRPKKKKRTNDDASSGNNNSNTIKQKGEYIEEREDNHKNTDVSSTVDNGVDSNSSNDDDDDDCNENLFEESNSEKGDGYESWTKGNWCWVLPCLHSIDKINESEQHPHDLCATERTTITRNRSSRRRCRRSQSSSVHVEVGGENDNKLDEDYVERDDEDDDDNDHNSSRLTKAGRNTRGYTEDQNERWNEKFQRLVTYKKEYNSTSVPFQYKEDPKLSYWVQKQRKHYNHSTLSETRVGRLESIGFAWNPAGEKWMKMYQTLVTYKKEFNSTSVPAKYKEDPKLGYWVQDQRKFYNHNTLSETRAGRLESIGFAWNPLGENWMKMYHKLLAYKKSHRSTKVPRHYVEDLELGNWVSHQRTSYNNKTISIERINRLESIGFVWDVYDAQWMECFHKLVSYKKKHKSTSVPRTYEEDPQLGHWVREQRKCDRKKKLTEKHTELLNSISFVWSVGRNFSDR